MKKLFLLLAVIVSVALGVQAQTKTIHGTVLSAVDDEPLLGATVMPLGGGTGVSTNVDGEFTLHVPVSVKEIKVSYIGMKPAIVAVSANMKIVLQSATNALDEVVVTGYGTGKKLGSVVGTVAVVGESTFADTPSANFVDALQGQVAGLNIYSSTGEPMSTPSSVMIRGVNSLNASNTPLYILDGAPVTSSVFNTLSPNDIESVAVLKDASAVAIYGSRAANGVIVITSKKGKFGQDAKVTFRANVGWSSMVQDKTQMMNSQQYIQFRDMINSPVSQEIRDLVNNYGIDTDWKDEMFSNNALMYSMEAAVQGGSERLSYYLSLSHYDQDGIIEQSGMRREALRASIDAKVNDWFRVGFQGNFGYAKYQTNWINDKAETDGVYEQNPMTFARMAFPYESPYYYSFDDNGNIVFGDRADKLHYSGKLTPGYYFKLRGGSNDRATINMNIYEQLNPIKGLTIRAQQAMDAYDNTRDVYVRPQQYETTPMGDVINPGLTSEQIKAGVKQVDGQVSKSFSRYYQFTYTNTAEYKFTLAEKHNISALIGQESIITRSRALTAITEGQYNPDMMMLSNGTSTNINLVGDSFSEYIMNSYFANVNYDFDNRYFIDASYRRDGSSKFAPGHRWANFFAVGAMWNAKGESFLENINWLSDLKLRINYGTTGNSGIGPWEYLGAVGQTTAYGGAAATVVSGASNPALSWETVKQLNIGLTMGFFDQRLTATADFYKKKTCDMLLGIPYSYTTGMSGALGNIGSMTNTGVDVEVRGEIFKNKDWYVGARVNFNYNKNELTELFDGRDEYSLPEYSLMYKVGHSPFEFYNTRYVGVDPRDGKQIWLDANGNRTKVWKDGEYDVLIGKSFIAPWTGGFGVDARYKGIRVSADFTWAAEKYMQNNDRLFTDNPTQFGDQQNQNVKMLDMWQKPGDITDVPAYGEKIQYDSRFMEDASFMRMKNITVAYTLPKKWLNAIRMQDITFHFTGRNLWTITDFSGYDPEPQANNIAFFYPNTRQYEFGVEVTF